VLDQHLCCGRPLYDYGFLDMAKSYLRRNLAALSPHISVNMPMVVLEPSCCSVFRDELNGLMPESARAHGLMEQTFTLSEFLSQHANGYQPPKLKRQAIVQGHCHHKAIMRMTEEETVMQEMGLDYKVLNSGCCGMAGSFGYEKEKYDISIKAGERALLPEVRKAGLSTLIMADGFSCKEQIEQETNRHALHLAEVISLSMKKGPHGPDGIYPEMQSVQPRLEAQRRSMWKSGAVVGGVIAAAIAFGILRRGRG
jgi:Fe-S oxidoreductase